MRRLPHTRCILFTVRTLVEPVTELEGAPGAAAALAASLRGMSQVMRAYKGLLQPQAQDDMLAYLDSLTAAGYELGDAGLQGVVAATGPGRHAGLSRQPHCCGG